MGLKPIRRIPSQNIEILAETSEIVLCKRNFNEGYTLQGSNHEYVAYGSNYEYVTWRKCRGTKNSFTLGHYFNHNLEEAFKDFLHRASMGVSREYIAVPRRSIQYYIEKTVEELNSLGELMEEFNVLDEEEVEELNDIIQTSIGGLYHSEIDIPHINNDRKKK